MKKKNVRPGMEFIPGVGWREFKRFAVMNYYYGVTIPSSNQRVTPTGKPHEFYLDNVGVRGSDTTIPLFVENIGENEYTNLRSPEKLPAGHEALIYRVGLGAKASPETKLMDLYTMLQFGHLTLESSTEFLSEELWSFPLCVYGNIASVYPDPMATLATEKYFGGDKDLGEKIAFCMKRLSGLMLLPIFIGASDPLKGTLTLRPGMTLSCHSFILYIILYSLTQIPLERKNDS